MISASIIKGCFWYVKKYEIKVKMNERNCLFLSVKSDFDFWPTSFRFPDDESDRKTSLHYSAVSFPHITLMSCFNTEGESCRL